MTRSSRLRADRSGQGDLKQGGEKVKDAFSNQGRAPQASVAGAWSSTGPGTIQTRADDLTFQYSSRTCLEVGFCPSPGWVGRPGALAKAVGTVLYNDGTTTEIQDRKAGLEPAS